MAHPCLTCGACCAHFRVSLHWSEADPAFGGQVPITLTEPLRLHELAMRGTSQAQPRCVALMADIGNYSRCTIHPRRPSACREVDASWEHGVASAQCDRARMAHGLAVLTRADWTDRDAGDNGDDGDDGDDDDRPDDNGGSSPSSPPVTPLAA